MYSIFTKGCGKVKISGATGEEFIKSYATADEFWILIGQKAVINFLQQQHSQECGSKSQVCINALGLTNK